MYLTLKINSEETQTACAEIKAVLRKMIDAVEIVDGKLDKPRQHNIERASRDILSAVLEAIGVKE